MRSMRKPHWLRRPSPAFVVAALALSVALGGTSYAAITVTGAQIKDGSITTRDIRDHTLRTEDFTRKAAPALPSAASAALQPTQTSAASAGLPPAQASAASAGLQSGDILAGVFDVRGQAAQAGETFRTT